LESEKKSEPVKMRTFTCPICGWTVTSPFGDDDIIDHAILHSKNHHSGLLTKSNAEAAKKRIKDA
jgi:hypothetical protein